MIYLTVITLIILAVIVYQDFKYFGISWILFPCVLISFISMVMINGNINTLLLNTGFNLGFLILLSGSVMLYVYIKEKGFKNISKYIGSGDLLFLLMVSVLLSPVNFILFNLASFMIILLVSGTVRIFRKIPQRIPMAGFQALLLFIIILLSYILSDITLFDDTFAIHFIQSLYG